MTTAGALIEATKRHLLASSRPALNELDAPVTDNDGTVNLAHAMGGVQQGAVLSIDLELLYVFSVSGQSATVRRGYNGTTPAAHADGSLVEVNSRWPAVHVLAELNNEIASYSSPDHGLYRVATATITYNAARSGYDLDVDGMIGDPIDVEGVGSLPGDRYFLRRWRVIRDVDTADFPSGTALYLYEGIQPGRAVRVTYRAPFSTLVTLADDVETVSGLPATAHDIPPLGAAVRLVAPREVRRSQMDAQPEPRAAQDVPPGSAAQAASALLRLRDRRLNEEANRLQASYPYHRRMMA